MNKEKDDQAVRALLKHAPDAADHFRKLIMQKDQKKAEQAAREYCTASFHVTYGEEISRLKAEVTEEDKTSPQRRKTIAAQEQRVAKTDSMIRVEDKIRKEIPDDHERDIRKWLDIGLGTICLIAAFFVLGMGASNVFSIIMASGTPIFLERPKLAWMLSGLLPLGAFALEFFKRHLRSDQAKQIYTTIVFGNTALLLLTWVVLFALVFGSPGDVIIDIGSLMKPSEGFNLATIFTMVQLLAELFVGAALFTTAGDLFAKHSPTKLIQNPDHVEATKLLEKMKKEQETAVNIQIKKKARLDVLGHGLTLYLSEQMANYDRLRAQLTD